MGSNEEVLREANRRGWVHVKKVAPVFARKLAVDTVVETLEGREVAKAGDMLCRGVAGELWPQKEERLLRNYRPTEVFDGEFRKYVPDPKHVGFLSVQIPHGFEVRTSYGTMRGKKGDFLIKNMADKDTSFPSDGNNR
jgi:hypothetical protein